MGTTHLARWGNSLALRIPKAVAEDAHLREGQSVTIAATPDGALVVKRARRRYTLDELVSRITAKNRHPETDWGKPQGKEIW